MKKILKFLGKFAAIYTFAEIVTMWRLQSEPISLPKYTLLYFKSQVQLAPEVLSAGYNLETPDGRRRFKNLAFPLRNQ